MENRENSNAGSIFRPIIHDIVGRTYSDVSMALNNNITRACLHWDAGIVDPYSPIELMVWDKVVKECFYDKAYPGYSRRENY